MSKLFKFEKYLQRNIKRDDEPNQHWLVFIPAKSTITCEKTCGADIYKAHI